MYEILNWLGQLVDVINTGFDIFRVFMRANIIEPFDALPPWIHLSIWLGLVFWFIGAVRFDTLVPAFSEKDLENQNFLNGLAEFVSKELKIEMNPKLTLPSVYLTEDEDQFLENHDYSYATEKIRGKYTPEWQRIHLKTKRMDVLVHELTHYFQHIYRGKIQFKDEDHAEAWIVAAKFMRRCYPVHYWILMFFYGILGLWDSKFAIL